MSKSVRTHGRAKAMFWIVDADRISRRRPQAGFVDLLSAAWFGILILAAFSGPASTHRGINEAVAAAMQSVSANEYRLGAQDKLRITLSAWRPATAEVFSWSALNGEYSVGASGLVSLPLIGDVPAAGATTSELARDISERLKDRIGLVESPDASVEVIQFRPVYVVGHVEKPGEFAYRPGMTVLQAVSIAGGKLRGPELGGQRLEREVISSTGELSQIDAERATLLARKARLEAELKGADRIDFPQALSTMGVTGQMAVEQEKLIFSARNQAFATQIAALEQLKQHLQKEIVSVEGQLQAHDAGIAAVKEELGSVQALARKGLASAPRRLELERNLAQTMGDRLRLESSLMRVKQDIARGEINILELKTKRTNDVTIELAGIGGKLESLSRRADTLQKLIYETEVLAPKSLFDQRRTSKLLASYTIIRQHKGMFSEISASETTLLEPGDTLKLDLMLPEEAIEAQKPRPSVSSGKPETGIVRLEVPGNF